MIITTTPAPASTRVRLRLGPTQDDGYGGTEHIVYVIDPSLAAVRVIRNTHDHYLYAYGATALDALRTAVGYVEDGSAKAHFDGIREVHATYAA